MRGVEPAALGQRTGQHLLELRRGGRHAALDLPEAAGVAERLEGRAQLLVAEALGHGPTVTGGDNAGVALEAPIRLTDLSHGAGCACKIGPGELREVLAALPRGVRPRVLVGVETCDDAGVYRITDELALVQTVDFFTPIVDDPHDFGRIAAANALSDVYAMGARPVTALNLVAFSLERLGGEVLAADPARRRRGRRAQAGVAIVGGHSIDDPEPKYGLAVTGVVHPDRVVRNSTARPGDVLFLTKPIGGGAVTTAAKRGIADAGGRARVHRGDDDAQRGRRRGGARRSARAR